MRTIRGRSDVVWVLVLVGAVVLAGAGCPKRVGPTANFTASATTGFAPVTIQFTDTSDAGTSPITAWSWDFDNDGTPDSTNQSPAYTFTLAGLYTVSLTVTTDVGSDTRAALGYVDIDPGVGPTASFNVFPTTGVAPLEVEFEDTSSRGTHPILEWQWDCDTDGTVDAPTQNTVFTFTAPGTYRATLAVITAADSDLVTGPPGNIVVSAPVGPTAAFDADPRKGTVPLEVQFTDYSLAGTSPIAEWNWDFDGDGNPDSGNTNPVHVFNAPGLYSITLGVATGVGSDSHTEPNYITAVDEPGTIWQQRTPHAAWNGRSAHTVVVNEEAGEMWLMGGYDNPTYYGDVWHSSDGVTWTQFTTVGAMWTPRYYHTSVFFKGKVWVMGGYDGVIPGPKDVWSSSDGVHWTLEQANAPWAPRAAHSSVVFNNRMWVIGGVETSTFNDVWSSPDGINWTQETAGAPWAARFAHMSVVHQGQMWVMGGWVSGGAINDVWSSPDGINWTPVLGTAPWPARIGAAAVAFNNEIWLMGGTDSAVPTTTYHRDVWRSPNGLNWTSSTLTAAWAGRAIFPGVTFDFRLWVIGGTDTNPPAVVYDDVWCSPGY